MLDVEKILAHNYRIGITSYSDIGLIQLKSYICVKGNV
jgi:hypothetical protein